METSSNAQSETQREWSDQEGNIRQRDGRSCRGARLVSSTVKRKPLTIHRIDRAAKIASEYAGRTHAGGIISKLINNTKTLLQNHEAQVHELRNQLADLELLAKSIDEVNTEYELLTSQKNNQSE